MIKRCAVNEKVNISCCARAQTAAAAATKRTKVCAQGIFFEVFSIIISPPMLSKKKERKNEKMVKK